MARPFIPPNPFVIPAVDAIPVASALRPKAAAYWCIGAPGSVFKLAPTPTNCAIPRSEKQTDTLWPLIGCTSLACGFLAGAILRTMAKSKDAAFWKASRYEEPWNKVDPTKHDKVSIAKRVSPKDVIRRRSRASFLATLRLANDDSLERNDLHAAKKKKGEENGLKGLIVDGTSLIAVFNTGKILPQSKQEYDNYKRHSDRDSALKAIGSIQK
ncbi:unnamed protein product [Notodromas monacha]|uniref:Uncharacterized protein n=1 Tax=Notodromas monacha TaxID=399045 RepID=A0A7R9BHK5_9CRUS|nr:unnamed protein product [Notodromas monacha]CAG0915379.1 unnamed protein product [Notodromas monacha]